MQPLFVLNAFILSNTGKKDILPFLQQHPEITVDIWSDIRTKVMNEQTAVRKRLNKNMAMYADDDS